jgi:hypothetical protein
MGILDGKPLEPLEVTRFPDQATDVTSLLNKGFHQVAADKAGSSSNERLQGSFSSTKISTKDFKILSVFIELSRRNPASL